MLLVDGALRLAGVWALLKKDKNSINTHPYNKPETILESTGKIKSSISLPDTSLTHSEIGA
jgi:hypothetical protein